MKGLLALATLMLLSGCASMKASEPAAPWTHWVCDSKAEIFWKYADAACTPQSERAGIPSASVARSLWRALQ
jgi:uncharacterized protein YceK